MNLDWLQTFVAFAQQESFTRAAHALHLSQPAVHAQVQKLSDALGVALYVRDGRAIRLTEEGRRTLAFGREVFARVTRFEEELRGLAPARPLVLAAGEGALLHLLPGAVRAILDAGIDLRTRLADASEAEALVRSAEAHIGVGVREATGEGLEIVTLAEFGNALAVPPGHELGSRTWVDVRALRDQRLVAPPEGAPLRRALDFAARAAGVELHVVLEAPSWATALNYVARGFGVAVVNDLVAAPPDVTKVRFRGLPRGAYRAFRRAGADHPPSAERSWELLQRSM